MTLKMRSRSIETKHIISMSQYYIGTSLKKIHPLVQKIYYLQVNDLENEVKVAKIQTALKLIAMIYLCKLGENPPNGSKDIPFTRL